MQRMTPEEDIDLAAESGHSDGADAELPPITEALRADLDARLEEERAHPDAESTWEDVKARILRRK